MADDGIDTVAEQLQREGEFGRVARHLVSAARRLSAARILSRRDVATLMMDIGLGELIAEIGPERAANHLYAVAMDIALSGSRRPARVN